MGSTGSGRFSDYPGNGDAIKGVTGGEGFVDDCLRAVKTRLEDVGTSGYYQQLGNVPPVGTYVKVAFTGRVSAVDMNGVIIGNLPTEYNYLLRCLETGYQYEGEVILSNNSPIPSVQIAVTPQKI